MPIPATLQNNLHLTTGKITEYFTTFVKNQGIADDRLRLAIEYSLLNGGKRMRPLLLSLVGEILGLEYKNSNGKK